ncbi:hypothetical protein HKD37_07G020425 [Glycine soja]
MKNVSIVVYCDGNIISSSQGVLFEYSSGLKVVRISEDMSLNTLRKIIMDIIGGSKILLDLSYRQSIYYIQLHVTFGRSPDEILALMCKPRSFDKIIALMHDKLVKSYFYFIKLVRWFFL